jgi:GxxExxY protein
MDANERESLELLVTDVVGAAYDVANALGSGFLEKVYERAMQRELRFRKHAVRTQVSYSIMYRGGLVGEYFADLVVDDRLVVELKCVEQLSKEHMAQCINYLKASGMPIALLINFERSKVHWKRIVNNL